MSRVRGWPLLAVAAAAVGIAVYAGPNQEVAIAAALVALVSVALFAVVVAGRTAARPRPPRPSGPSVERSPFRISLNAGRSGRSEVVVLLDELDRRTAHPLRPMTSGLEIARLRALPRVEFRAYVQSRLDSIEGDLP